MLDAVKIRQASNAYKINQDLKLMDFIKEQLVLVTNPQIEESKQFFTKAIGQTVKVDSMTRDDINWHYAAEFLVAASEIELNTVQNKKEYWAKHANWLASNFKEQYKN